MTAITWERGDVHDQGLCPFDGRRHLQQVAELISVVFADELDASGRGALQEMRWVSRLSPFLGGLLSSTLFSEFVLGYVWIEDHRVVGNVTFQRSDYVGTRWRISNVAVDPAFRGRGIARRLMLAALHEIAQRGGSWAILQVRVDNPTARHLYDSLGFGPVCQDGLWERPAISVPGSQIAADADAENLLLQALGARHWQDRLELARSARSQLAHWAAPVEPADYQPGLGRALGSALGDITGLQRNRAWGVWQQQRLMGIVEVTASGVGGSHRLSFEVHPEARGQLERGLVARGLRALAGAVPHPIVVEHSGDHNEGVAALTEAGFRAQRILLTMRRLSVPADLQ
jgi:ribosomal protein S18 acetylase RimI-like enzyme